MRIVFVTQELDPYVPGGAGAVVDQLARGLSPKHDVTVILVAPQAAADPGTPFRLVPVTVPEADGTFDWFLERSRRCADALGDLVAEHGRPDLVEFTDFEALGFWSLCDRGRLGLGRSRLAVRLHGPFGAIAAAVGATPYPWREIDAIEREVFAMADIVVLPSAPMGSWIETAYSVSADRVMVAPPIVPPVPAIGWQPSAPATIAAFGRLTEQKGVDVLVDAAVPLLEADGNLSLLLVGPDGWSAVENRPMSAVLLGRVPAHLQPRVRLAGSVMRDDALRLLARSSVVVVPSRFETFCLAAHEVRRAGLPLVVAAQPAFAGMGESEGVVAYDGTVAALTATLVALLAEPDRLARLAASPAPFVADPVPAYGASLPTVRHPDAQAALATAAVHRLESLRATLKVGGFAGPARRALQLLPDPLARLAIWLVPRRLKERFRGVASWPAEMERRDQQRRRAAIEAGIRRGRYPVLATPRVSVVIPCYDHGRFIAEALASVFEQSFDSWEVIVVDDGSTDPETVALLDAIAWPRVRLIRQANTGLPGARNTGIASARGEFIVSLDADDALLPRYMERMIGALQGAPDAGYAHCWAELFGDVNRVWATRPFNPYAIRLSNSVLQVAMIRREALAQVGGYDPTMTSGNEDWDLWMRMLEAGIGNVQVSEVLYRYRKQGVSMSVATLADFEAGRRRIVSRHPALYQPGELRRAKREFYPAVSVISPFPVDGVPADGDAEILVGPDPCGLARSAAGKYLLDPGLGTRIDYDAVERLVDVLEESPELAAATEGGITLVRRWAVLDPDAPLIRAPGLLSCPDPHWVVPPTLVLSGRELTVERQRPEEAARIPGGLEP